MSRMYVFQSHGKNIRTEARQMREDVGEADPSLDSSSQKASGCEGTCQQVTSYISLLTAGETEAQENSMGDAEEREHQAESQANLIPDLPSGIEFPCTHTWIDVSGFHTVKGAC